MITFIDAQEAELWRATVAAWIASHREYTGDGDAIENGEQLLAEGDE